ncbi:hypothetical protein DVJ83_14015 (plasmid) [Deinococcus wulumuqiensis]|uniref:Uncharacterized protein n=1 Tax=Deinococcus wulumuqiensis TaxID=980427 RepID=A0A345IL66_9DEIO|nr:hypothetical protein DVJ83_14015 [Deinococcus wulumuqiensis]
MSSAFWFSDVPEQFSELRDARNGTPHHSILRPAQCFALAPLAKKTLRLFVKCSNLRESVVGGLQIAVRGREGVVEVDDDRVRVPAQGLLQRRHVGRLHDQFCPPPAQVFRYGGGPVLRHGASAGLAGQGRPGRAQRAVQFTQQGKRGRGQVQGGGCHEKVPPGRQRSRPPHSGHVEKARESGPPAQPGGNLVRGGPDAFQGLWNVLLGKA